MDECFRWNTNKKKLDITQAIFWNLTICVQGQCKLTGRHSELGKWCLGAGAVAENYQLIQGYWYNILAIIYFIEKYYG